MIHHLTRAVGYGIVLGVVLLLCALLLDVRDLRERMELAHPEGECPPVRVVPGPSEMASVASN
jgi:hypothetical protein